MSALLLNDAEQIDPLVGGMVGISIEPSRHCCFSVKVMSTISLT